MPMLYAILAACATLAFVLAVSHAAKAHRLARLFRAQQERADPIDRHDSPADDNAVTIGAPARIVGHRASRHADNSIGR